MLNALAASAVCLSLVAALEAGVGIATAEVHDARVARVLTATFAATCGLYGLNLVTMLVLVCAAAIGRPV